MNIQSISHLSGRSRYMVIACMGAVLHVACGGTENLEQSQDALITRAKPLPAVSTPSHQTNAR